MLATSGPWFDRRRPENTWPSIVVSVALTCALFVSAFLAMQTVGQWTGTRSEPLEPPIVVRLTPPPIVERTAPVVRRPPVPPSPVVPSQTAPDVPSPASTAPPGAPIIAAPTVASPLPAAPATDTATAKGPVIPRGPVPAVRPSADVPYATPPAVAASPSGVTIGSRTANTQEFRDRVLTEKMKTFAEMAATHPPTGADLAALQQSQATALKTYRRATTAGSADVHVAQGQGMNGEGAVGGSPLMMSRGKRSSASAKDVLSAGGGSVSLPFLSPGPSAAQRKKNEAIEKDYQMRLRRLEDRIALQRDSIRRDSLRLDSLRRDSLARPRP